MAVWRCPHCATPQAEAARCWVCHRSTTSCATCRHFRRAVASGLGMCGLDPQRVALTGREMRACWAATDPVPDEAPAPGRRVAAALVPLTEDRPERRPRTFVPVDELGISPRDLPVIAPPPVAAPQDPTRGWSLWGDADA